MQDSERWAHAEVKMALYHALFGAIRQSARPFEIAIDSLGVRTSDRDLYEPDVVVFPAGLIGPDDLFAPEPIIVAEVLSPSTTKVDLTTKLAGYSRVETIANYLALDPPSITVQVDNCFKR